MFLSRGVFVIHGAPSTREQAVHAACLGTEGAFASHLTAGWLWGLLLPDPVDIHLTTTEGPRIRREGIVHHRRFAPMADFTRSRGIPVTTVARTLVDTSGLVRPDRLGRVVDDALRRKLVVLADLKTCHERIATGSGRRATVAMRAVLAEREDGHDPGGSDRELWVRDVLVRAGLPVPVQQHRVWVSATRWFDLDLAYPSDLVSLEFDGWDTHRTFTAFHRDRERARLLVALGWTMLPVTAKTPAADLVRSVRSALGLSGRFRTASGQN